MNSKLLLFLISIFTGFNFVFQVPLAQANCADSIASLELVQPFTERLWDTINNQQSTINNQQLTINNQQSTILIIQ